MIGPKNSFELTNVMFFNVYNFGMYQQLNNHFLFMELENIEYTLLMFYQSILKCLK